ncbi:MAG: DUF1804 family protein [Betaproteobacteria bacterium]|nr:DUF1804 family protein [Betaproteobacteria bacterium]
MAHGEEKTRALRAAYVFDQLSLEAAAKAQGVPEATARRWKRAAKSEGDDWDKARGAQLLAGGGIEQVVRQTLAVVVRQVQAVTESIDADPEMPPQTKVQLLASLSDAYHKIMLVSRRLMPETDRLGVATDVLRRFGEHLAQNKPGLLPEFSSQLEAFGAALARDEFK